MQIDPKLYIRSHVTIYMQGYKIAGLLSGLDGNDDYLQMNHLTSNLMPKWSLNYDHYNKITADLLQSLHNQITYNRTT